MSNVICHNGELIPDDSGEPPRATTHAGVGFSVTSRLSLGVEPRLELSWSVDSRWWADGYTLMVFHSTTGFSPERYPDDLHQHGRLVIETASDGRRDERPSEGTHFYTFVLHKRTFLGLGESSSVVRFSETVPSAKVGIGRIRDMQELENLMREHELGPIEHETRVNEAEVRRVRSRHALEHVSGTAKHAGGADGIIADELAGIDAMVATLAAKRDKIAALRKDKRFTKLNREEQQQVISRIEERLDAGEVSARRDMRES